MPACRACRRSIGLDSQYFLRSFPKQTHRSPSRTNDEGIAKNAFIFIFCSSEITDLSPLNPVSPSRVSLAVLSQLPRSHQHAPLANSSHPLHPNPEPVLDLPCPAPNPPRNHPIETAPRDPTKTQHTSLSRLCERRIGEDMYI